MLSFLKKKKDPSAATTKSTSNGTRPQSALLSPQQQPQRRLVTRPSPLTLPHILKHILSYLDQSDLQHSTILVSRLWSTCTRPWILRALRWNDGPQTNQRKLLTRLSRAQILYCFSQPSPPSPQKDQAWAGLLKQLQLNSRRILEKDGRTVRHEPIWVKQLVLEGFLEYPTMYLTPLAPSLRGLESLRLEFVSGARTAIEVDGLLVACPGLKTLEISALYIEERTPPKVGLALSERDDLLMFSQVAGVAYVVKSKLRRLFLRGLTFPIHVVEALVQGAAQSLEELVLMDVGTRALPVQGGLGQEIISMGMVEDLLRAMPGLKLKGLHLSMRDHVMKEEEVERLVRDLAPTVREWIFVQEQTFASTLKALHRLPDPSHQTVASPFPPPSPHPPQPPASAREVLPGQPELSPRYFGVREARLQVEQFLLQVDDPANAGLDLYPREKIQQARKMHAESLRIEAEILARHEQALERFHQQYQESQSDSAPVPEPAIRFVSNNWVTSLELIPGSDHSHTGPVHALHTFLCNSPHLLHLKASHLLFPAEYFDINGLETVDSPAWSSASTNYLVPVHLKVQINTPGRRLFSSDPKSTSTASEGLVAERHKTSKDPVWACRNLQTLHLGFTKSSNETPYPLASRILFGYLIRVCPNLRDISLRRRELSLTVESGFCLLTRLTRLEKLVIDTYTAVMSSESHERLQTSDLTFVTPKARTTMQRLERKAYMLAWREYNKIIGKRLEKLLKPVTSNAVWPLQDTGVYGANRRPFLEPTPINCWPYTAPGAPSTLEGARLVKEGVYSYEDLVQDWGQIGQISDVKAVWEKLGNEIEFDCWPRLEKILVCCIMGSSGKRVEELKTLRPKAWVV